MNNHQRWNEGLGQAHQQTIFQLTGYDRLNFVGDITNAIPRSEECHITNLVFEADGVQAKGHLVVGTADASQLALIDRRLRSVRGLVSIYQTN